MQKISDKKHILKGLFILFGFLFLINIIPADSKFCWVESNSADCLINGGQVVMKLSGSTNAHGALAGEGAFAPVLCCNFGAGNTTCTVDNKILELSSSTNAHAEAPDLITPNYNIDVCYDSLKDCSEIDAEANCDASNNEIEVLYLSSGESQSYTNAHIEGAGLYTQNYNSKICCALDKNALCGLTSATWAYEEAYEGTNVEAIVYGEHCADVEISFEVFRGENTCEDIGGCVNPSIVVFGSGSNSVSGIWNASPYNDERYSFIASVVGGSSSVKSNNTLLVTPDECDRISFCKDYTQGYCEADGCEVAGASVPEDIDCDDPDIDCFCYWDETKGCDAGWNGTDPGGVCPPGPDPSDVCNGVIVPIYNEKGEICDAVYGTKDCTAVCPDGPDPSTICSIGLIVPVLNENDEICKVVTGTKDCTDVCPDGPDPATICSGSFEFVYDTSGYICKVVWGTLDCVICPSKPTAEDVCIGVTVDVYDTAGEVC